jgi:hypothetical protein
MSTFKIIAAAAFTLILVDPAIAATSGGHGMRSRVQLQPYGQPAYRMTAQDFDHFDFGIARPTYHSGWGGPYGDGDYPGSVDQNMGPPYWSAR